MVQAPQVYQLPPRNHPVHPPVADFGRVPDTRQRKLGEHTCDGKKVCWDWVVGSVMGQAIRKGKCSFRSVRVVGFQRSQDVKVDALGHLVKGEAKR